MVAYKEKGWPGQASVSCRSRNRLLDRSTREAINTRGSEVQATKGAGGSRIFPSDTTLTVLGWTNLTFDFRMGVDPLRFDHVRPGCVEPPVLSLLLLGREKLFHADRAMPLTWRACASTPRILGMIAPRDIRDRNELLIYRLHGRATSGGQSGLIIERFFRARFGDSSSPLRTKRDRMPKSASVARESRWAGIGACGNSLAAVPDHRGGRRQLRAAGAKFGAGAGGMTPIARLAIG